MSLRADPRRIATLLAISAVPVTVLAVFFLLPVGAMISRGLGPDTLDVLGRARVHRVLWFTLWSAAAGTAGSLALGLPAAYVLYRLRFPGVAVLRAMVLAPFVLPTVVVGVAFRHLLGESGPLAGLGLDGSAIAIIAGLVFFNASVVVRVVGGAWATLDPRPAEAAAAMGAGPIRVLTSVVWPSLRPAIVSATTVVFLFCATAFGVVLTLGGLRYSSVETEIYLLTTVQGDLTAAAALSLLQLIVVIGLLVTTARTNRRTGSAPQPVRPRRPSSYDVPALLATASLLLLVLTPIVGLVTSSLRTDNGWSLDNYRALGGDGEDQALLVPAQEALVISLRTAVDATWLALLLGLCIAVVVTRRSRSRSERQLRGLLDGLFMLPLGVSAVTLGFGFLISLDEPPLDLRSSPLLVPIAQALVALPLVVRTLAPVLASIDDRLRQAASSLGASPLRAALTVDLPVIWQPLLAAGGFAFAVSLGEFGATSFVVRDDRPTLPVVIYRLISHPGAMNYGMAMAASVLLALLIGVVMFAVERLRAPLAVL